MASTRVLLTAVVLAVAAACGGGGDATGPAVSRNNPGTGTGTLRVTADIEASSVPGGMSTDFTVTLRDGLDSKVSGATVNVSNPSLGTVTLTETGAGSGEYVNTRLTFPSGDFKLTVVRGTNNVQGIVLGGPLIKTFTSSLPPVNVFPLSEGVGTTPTVSRRLLISAAVAAG